MSEQHHNTILQSTPHSARHTAQCRVHICSLPAVRAGSNSTAVNEAAGEGSRYQLYVIIPHKTPACVLRFLASMLHENYRSEP